MPTIRIDYDDQKLDQDEILTLSESVQKIVSETTKIEDVFVYANSSQIKVKIAPIEIFVQMNAERIENVDVLFNELKSKISSWKKETSFPHPINLTLIPMHWKFDIDI